MGDIGNWQSRGGWAGCSGESFGQGIGAVRCYDFFRLCERGTFLCAYRVVMVNSLPNIQSRIKLDSRLCRIERFLE